MATLHAEVPQQLWQQAQNMVDRGWVSNLDDWSRSLCNGTSNHIKKL